MNVGNCWNCWYTVYDIYTRTHTYAHTSMGSGLLSLTIALFCVGGVALSYYAIHIEHMKSENNDYQATCDLDEKISCSKVVTSK